MIEGDEENGKEETAIEGVSNNRIDMRYEQVIGDVHENEKELSSCEDCALFDVCCRRDFDTLLRARTKVIVGVVGDDGGERGRPGKTGCCISLLF